MNRILKIGLIGGIYGPGGVRTSHLKITPETTLEDGLRAAGHSVTTFSHYDALDASGFDVVHVHHLSYGALRMASNRGLTPLVFTAHDASRMNGSPTSVAREAALRYVVSRADGLVNLSQPEAAFLRDHYPVAGAQVQVIPNGINTSVFQFARTNGGGRVMPWRLLFVGQLIPLKGCELLLRAMALLPENTELSLVYQHAPLESMLRQLAQSLGVASRVRFLGKRSPEELNLLYQSSDILVLPSETEALPSVITEAMLCGLPFVAASVGGIADQAGGFGRLFADRTPAALAATILGVLDHYPSFDAAAARMRLYAQGRFSIAAMIAQHLDLYRSLPGSNTRRSQRLPFADWVVRAALLRAPSPVSSNPESSGTRAATNRS
jgi:glycosyltransferase involved in cell wall biosynthesis